MFSKLRDMLNVDPEMDESVADDEMMNDQTILDGQDPEQILNDPSASYELKKQAIIMIKDRYLKPRD